MPSFPVSDTVAIPEATELLSGLMSAEDKKKLAELAALPPPKPVFFPPVVMETSGDMPIADIVLFGGKCERAKLPTTQCGRFYVVCHNMTLKTVTITAQEKDELFGYSQGYGLARSESVSMVCEPNSNRWRIL